MAMSAVIGGREVFWSGESAVRCLDIWGGKRCVEAKVPVTPANCRPGMGPVESSEPEETVTLFLMRRPSYASLRFHDWMHAMRRATRNS